MLPASCSSKHPVGEAQTCAEHVNELQDESIAPPLPELSSSCFHFCFYYGCYFKNANVKEKKENYRKGQVESDIKGNSSKEKRR